MSKENYYHFEIFSKNFDKLVSEYQMSRLFSFETVSRYLQNYSDRDRTTALNNLIRHFTFFMKIIQKLYYQ